MFLRFITLTLILLSLVACNKPDPNPELKDPIYSDLNTRLGAATQALEAQKKKLEEAQKEMADVVPQTGQIKYAQKRLYEAQNRIFKLAQEVQFLELKIEARKREAKQSYSVAFKKGEEWPDPKEFAAYDAQNRLRKILPDWDSRVRVRDLAGGGAKKSGGGEGHGEAAKESGEGAPKAEGGEHH